MEVLYEFRLRWWWGCRLVWGVSEETVAIAAEAFGDGWPLSASWTGRRCAAGELERLLESEVVR